MAEFDLDVIAGTGSFAVRLGDRCRHGSATFRSARWRRTGGPTAARGSSRPRVQLKPGKTYRVEFAFVDRRASLALDGKEVVPPLDLPADPPAKVRRDGVSRPVQLGAAGVTVVVRNLRLFRDIHYTTAGKPGPGWRLGADEYFLLGDNTSNSTDSRLWTIGEKPAPGVPVADFIGKPFLIHQPLRLGRVTVAGEDRTFRTLDWSRVRWLR